ncbi:MAG TPA: S4 domain-containing protein, partial [Acidobacteriota bacterium]|nr:S4 domain-containing protein [Acidobacteriota bacterium]
ARQAYLSAVGQFGSADPEWRVATSSAVAGIRVEAADIIPSTKIPRARFADGLDIVQALIETGLVPSKGEARRLVSQGGVTVNDRKVESAARRLGEADLTDGAVVIKLGKKRFHRLVAE